MRSSRLIAILLELTRSPRMTVQLLAERHGVTPRTIQRDIASLHSMGVPLWTRTGPHGGVGLVEGWRSPITGMTAGELQALIIGEAASQDLGLHADFATARLKVLTTMPAQSNAVEPAQERFILDNERWFVHSEPPAALPEVAHAVWSGRRLTIEYERPGRGHTPVKRLLDPLGLVLKTDSWYFVAAHRRSLRTYRLSRITSTVVHEDDAWRPPDFSLAEYWSRSRTEFEAAIHTLPVRLSLPVSSVEDLRAAVPGAGTENALDTAVPSADRVEIELLMERLEIAAAQLMAVPGVEVVQPDELRGALFDRSRELMIRNPPRETGGPVRPLP